MTVPQLDTLALAQAHAPELVAFVQRLVQTPSLPGQEGEVARLVEHEMWRLGYDEVATDRVGNVIGTLRGATAPSLMFNGHMDHVDPGDSGSWPYPPYSGALVDGELWGRGTVDMKAALAAMIYAGGLARRNGLTLPGDLIVAAVVLEEGGGVGTHEVLTYLRPGMCVVGESSAGSVMRGHRGRVEFVARVAGRSVHASVPDLGANPHYPLARFLTRLEGLAMAVDPVFGPASVAPTLYRTDQTSPNVTPGEARLTLDWRTLPGQDADEIASQLERLLREDAPDGFKAEVLVVENHFTTYTGQQVDLPARFPSFSFPVDHWLVGGAQRAVSRVLGREVPVGIWRFATDGGQAAALGIPTVGFGPGDPNVVHTNRECVTVTSLVEALAGYLALATELPRQVL
jgi:putative selenium metabolism hydrolase